MTVFHSESENTESEQKIYKSKAIQIATFLGGPLVAGYLIAENYKVFNEVDKAKRSWIYAIIATVIIFGGAFLIPDSVSIPKIVIPLIYSWITYYLVQRYQGEQIDAHITGGGNVHNWWRIIGISLVGLVVTLILLFILVYFTTSI